MEITILGNVSEDVRRTGEWDWAMAELEVARQLDIDAAAMSVVDAATAMFRILRGQSDDASRLEINQRLETLEDRDMEASIFDLNGLAAFGRGDWPKARDEWLKGVPISDFNAPYILPRVAVAAILARDADGGAGGAGRARRARDPGPRGGRGPVDRPGGNRRARW